MSRVTPGRAFAVIFAVCTSACSALLDWSDYTGGLGDAGAGDGGGADGAPSDATTDAASDGSEAAPPSDVVIPCSGGGSCAANAPSNWMGPVSLYVGAGAPPACAGGAASLFDGKGDLIAPAATCTSCGCGAATGVSCAAPVLTGFEAPDCSSGGTTQTVSSSCGGPILATAVTVAAPQPTGSCTPSGGAATVMPPVWDTQARACAVSPSGTCSGGELCVPAQASSPSVCIMQPGAAMACPTTYPSGPQIFYTGLDDGRGCSACTCAASGATCTIASPAIDVYEDPTCTSAPTATLSAPSACTTLGTSLFVQLVAAPMLSGQGTCATSGGGTPTGTATGMGATSFCCLP